VLRVVGVVARNERAARSYFIRQIILLVRNPEENMIRQSPIPGHGDLESVPL
jgi:hypothetical protein